jgi:hypothetical protein
MLNENEFHFQLYANEQPDQQSARLLSAILAFFNEAKFSG